MVAKLRLVFTFSILFLSFYGFSQQNYWKRASTSDHNSRLLIQEMDVSDGKLFTVDEKSLVRQLSSLTIAKRNSSIVYFPDQNGNPVAFRVREAPVLSPGLQAKYPEIRSFVGRGVIDVQSNIRFSTSPKGVQSMITYPDKKSTFMQKASKDQYMVYVREGHIKKEIDFICSTESIIEKTIGSAALKPVDDQVLRKYRLAVSASGEYTAFHGGTVADALAAINATITRVNQVFETDLAVTLELVADTDKVIYTNSNTDPYDGNLNSQVQGALTTQVGEANYDIGHLFHKDVNGGNAGFIGKVCDNGQKGSAFSAAQVPVGDIFDLDFVAHEMGHQLGANHTWSFESEGTLVQAEPGSGTTIMGYAGITGNNDVAPNGDDYFHYLSVVQIIGNLESKSCGTNTPIINNPPVVEAGSDYVIPKSTPFLLMGNATDPDTGDVLTYTWEQIDNGVVSQATFGPTNPSGANFRSRKPGPNPFRYFPRLLEILQGNLTQTVPLINSAWETLSNVQREMNFAFTVRDNALGGGQVVSDLVNIQVVNSAGPFNVTSQQTNETVVAGAVNQITWNVANTNQAPVNVQQVDILLSTDGGLTFPLVLAEGTLNDGIQNVIIPAQPTTSARIMIRSVGNIFFAVNDVNFTIQDAEIVLDFPTLEYQVCQPDDLIIDFTYETSLGFNEEATFSIVTPPPGLGFTFFPTTATAGDTPVTLTISNIGSVAPGIYNIRVLATTASLIKDVQLQVGIFDANFIDVPLLAPLDGAIDVATVQILEWETNPSYTAYDLEIATDVTFSNIIEATTVVGNSHMASNRENETTYFWRVKPKNACGEGAFGPPFSYTTIQFSCLDKPAEGLPLTISPTGTPTISSKIAFFEDLPIADLNVSLVLDHTFLADLVVTLTSPLGTQVTLIASSCGELKNVDATFDDDAPNFICSGDPAIQGTIKPLGALDSFNGESIFGEWTLTVEDNAASDGGSLKAFSLQVCVEGVFSPDEDNDGIFDADDLCPGTVTGTKVDASGCPIYKFPKDNFQISIESESCRPNNDGAIHIKANLPLDYTVTVLGGSVNVINTFTSTYTLGSLQAGAYTVCINAAEGAFNYEELCFDVVLTEPAPLGVSSKIAADNGQVVLSLEGSERYFVEFNGNFIQTTASQLVLDLKKGPNALKISTGLTCQGIYEEAFFVSEGIVIFPNPVIDFATIHTDTRGLVRIYIYAENGRLVRSGTKDLNAPETQLDFTGLNAGPYIVRIIGATQNRTLKIIKR